MASKAEKREFEMLWIRAKLAGIEAGEGTTPEPMIVTKHANMADDSSPIEKAWFVPSGVCGFASIVIKPATSKFAKFVKEIEGPHGTYGSYYGGLGYSIGDYGQSYERKTAHAHAMAKVLGDAGIRTYVDARLD